MSKCSGEEELARFNETEDTKGNPGKTGSLLLTNMRMIWYLPGKRLNLSKFSLIAKKKV